MTKVLITGGAGYVGSHIALALMDAHYEVYVLDNESTGNRRLIAELPDHAFVRGDIGMKPDISGWFMDHKFEYVVHCAALTSAPDSIKRPERYYDTNVARMQRLLRYCPWAGVKGVVFSSSAAVYGHVLGRVKVKTTVTPDPINPYGRTKLIGEWMLEDSSLNHVNLRYFNVAGADPQGRTGQLHRNGSLFQAILAAAETNGTLKLHGDGLGGYPVRDFIHPTDLANAHVQALRFMERRHASGEKTSHHFNVGTGWGHTTKAVVDMFVRQGALLDVEFAPPRDGDPPYVVADPDTTIQTLDWEASEWSSLMGMVTSAIQWDRSDKRREILG